MKFFSKAGVGVLTLILGVPLLLCAQDEPRQQEPRPEPKTEEHAKPPKQEAPKPESKQDEVKPPKESKPEKHQEEAKPSPSEQQPAHTQNARPAGKSAHIPDKDFHSHFGRAHTVVIHQPVIVEGQPRFQYGGYWFIISDPWPAGWLYTDDCYIDYVDGDYFLFDLLHPDVRIALVVVM